MNRTPSRLRRLAAVALFAAILPACDGRRERPVDEVREAAPPVATRVKVVEAHSLIIDGQRVRLSNAEAPELFPGARCWGEAVLAKQAFFAVVDAVEAGRDVLLRPAGRENRWGQALAEVVIDGVDIGDMLYAQGLASRPTGRRFNWCAEVDPNTAGAPTLDPLFAMARP